VKDRTAGRSSSILRNPRLETSPKQKRNAIGCNTTHRVRVAMYREAFKFIGQQEALRV
jgi:hypothetical protein